VTHEVSILREAVNSLIVRGRNGVQQTYGGADVRVRAIARATITVNNTNMQPLSSTISLNKSDFIRSSRRMATSSAAAVS